MLYKPFYDPEKTYQENFDAGPFGDFADGKIFQQTGSPNYGFFSHKVFAPFGIPAGPLINGPFVQAALDKGFDIVTHKTVRTRKYPCHAWPNVLAVDVLNDLTLELAAGQLTANHNYHEPLSITNSFGVPSLDPDFWQPDLAKVVKNTRPGQVIVGGYQGTKSEDGNVESYIADFILGARLLKETGVKVIEVNLSCPNEGTANLLCFDTERSVKIAHAIKNEVGNLPVIIKVGYYQDVDHLKNFVKQIGLVIDGISAINTIAAEIVDESGTQALPGTGRLRSGVCGHSIKWAGLDMVKRLHELRAQFNYKFTIIGVGGVTTPQDFVDYRQAGADIAMSATGAMWNPYLAQEVKLLLNT